MRIIIIDPDALCEEDGSDLYRCLGLFDGSSPVDMRAYFEANFQNGRNRFETGGRDYPRWFNARFARKDELAMFLLGCDTYELVELWQGD